MVSSPLIRPYFLGGLALGGALRLNFPNVDGCLGAQAAYSFVGIDTGFGCCSRMMGNIQLF